MQHDDKDKIAAVQELFEEVGTYRSREDFSKLLVFINKFPRYKPFNAMLIHVQKPGSVFVATASEWKNRFKRTIKPEARPIVLLQPHGPVIFTFELNDTEGEDVPELALNPFLAKGNDPQKQFDYLIDNLIRYGIRYKEVDHGTMSAGVIGVNERPYSEYLLVKNKTVEIKMNFTLMVNKNLGLREKFATIAHELGHFFCGHLDYPPNKIFPDRHTVAKNVREFEAETVSWLVCSYVKVDSPSVAYLSEYTDKDGKIPPINLDTLLRATGRVEEMCERKVTIPKELILSLRYINSQ